MKRIQLLVLYLSVSFILHLIWEMAQMPLFKSAPDSTFWETFRMCLFATATGDMLFMLIIYLTLAVAHKDLWWFCKSGVYRHPATWVLPVEVGVLLAISFELWAIHAVGRWEYESMPLVPIILVGVTPLLQMILIPIAAVYSCYWTKQRFP